MPLPDLALTVLTVANQKGGVGKSSLVGELAVAAAADGHAVAVIDMDPQQTLATWAANRRDSGLSQIAAIALAADELEPRLKALDAVGCRLVIIDSPPAYSDISEVAIAASDLVRAIA